MIYSTLSNDRNCSLEPTYPVSKRAWEGAKLPTYLSFYYDTSVSKKSD